MSGGRRLRKKKAAKGGMGKKILLWSLLSLFLLTIIGVAGVYLYVKSYLSSEQFRNELSQTAKDELNVDEALIAPLDWDGEGVRCNSVELLGHEFLTELKAEGVSTEFDRWKLLRRACVLNNANIDKLELVLADVPFTKRSKPDEAPDWVEENLLPEEFSLLKGCIRSFSVTYGSPGKKYSLSNVTVDASGDSVSRSYLFDLRGGKLKLPFFFCPKFDVRNGVILYNYEARRLNMPTCRLSTVNNGYLDVKGDCDFENAAWSVNIVVNGIPTGTLFKEGLEKYLKGDWNGSIELRGENGKLVHLAGLARIQNGMVSDIPLQNKLADFCGSNRFRQIALHKGSARFSYKDGVWNLTDIALESENLIRMEGSLMIGVENELDGRLRLGLRGDGPWSKLPGFSDVFTPAGEDGFVWAYVNVGGTLSSPSEDLSTRLLMAAGNRIGKSVINTVSAATDVAGRLLGMGKKDEAEKNADAPDDATEKKEEGFKIPTTDDIPKSILPGLNDAAEKGLKTGGELMKELMNL